MGKIDTLLKKVEFFEKLAVYGDRSSILKALAQAPVQTLPETTIVGNPPIPKDVQEMLSNIVTVEGLGLPLKSIDGLIGPETLKAMNAFRGKFGDYSDKQIINAIRNVYTKDPGRYGELVKSKQPAPKAPAQKPAPAQQPYQNLDEAARKKHEFEQSTWQPPGTPGSQYNKI